MGMENSEIMNKYVFFGVCLAYRLISIYTKHVCQELLRKKSLSCSYWTFRPLIRMFYLT